MKRVCKYFLFWQYEKEEAWLRDMAKNGYVLEEIDPLFYHFKESLPGEYNLAIGLLREGMHEESDRDYVDFIIETGAEYVGERGAKAYFRRPSGDGPLVINSDREDIINFLKSRVRFLRKDSLRSIIFIFFLCIFPYIGPILRRESFYYFTMDRIFVIHTALVVLFNLYSNHKIKAKIKALSYDLDLN